MSLKLVDQKWLDAALKSYEESGLEGLTESALAEQAGALPEELSLEEILGDLFLYGLYDHQLGVLAAFREGANGEAGVKDLISFHLDWHRDKTALAKFLVEYKPPRGNPQFKEKRKEMNKSFVPQIMAWLMPRVADGQIRTLPPELYHAFLFAPVQEYSRNWLFGKSRNEPEQMKEHFQAAVWASLKGEKG